MGNAIIDHIDDNFSTFESQMISPTCCTLLAYNISRVDLAYYNACISVSTPAIVDNPVVITPVLFATLSTELTWSRYTPPSHLIAPIVTCTSGEGG